MSGKPVEKVLVLDDSKFQRGMVSRMVKNLGFEVVEGEDGKQGLELAKQHQFSFVFTDILMPNMTGIEFARIFTSIYPGIPVVVVSADIQDAVKDECASIGVYQFLSKPCTEDQIDEVIKQLRGK